MGWRVVVLAARQLTCDTRLRAARHTWHGAKRALAMALRAAFARPGTGNSGRACNRSRTVRRRLRASC